MVKWVREQKAAGAKIIINTARATTLGGKIWPLALKTVEKWLETNDIPYDEIWTKPGKPKADLYVDDRAARPEEVE
jgi:hypothetical protein